MGVGMACESASEGAEGMGPGAGSGGQNVSFLLSPHLWCLLFLFFLREERRRLRSPTRMT